MTHPCHPPLAARLRGLYGIVDVPAHTPPPFAPVALATALLDGGARVLQLRCKGGDARMLADLAGDLQALCRRAGALFIVNDRLDVALAVDADGVHLGQDDLPLDAARRIAPPGFIIGISTHHLAQAQAAARAGADYLGFGPIFATVSKAQPDPQVGLSALEHVTQTVALPIVAIGGISVAAASSVARAGACAAAIIAAVNHAPTLDEVTRRARLVGQAFSASVPPPDPGPSPCP